MSYDRNACSTPPPGLRLLPWESDTGKPCLLAADAPDSKLSRVADEIEEDQLDDGADVFEGARLVLADHTAGEQALRLALRAATHALGYMLRVADSRGARLAVAGDGAVTSTYDNQDDREHRGTGSNPYRQSGGEGTMNLNPSSGGNGGDDGLPGEPWPGPQEPPTPDGGPGVPNPPQPQGA